jgi:formate/nitrite transporter FocA (FNT family)
MRQPKPNQFGDWFSRFTATTAGVFVGGGLLLVAMYFIVSHQVNKAIANIDKSLQQPRTTSR